MFLMLLVHYSYQHMMFPGFINQMFHLFFFGVKRVFMHAFGFQNKTFETTKAVEQDFFHLAFDRMLMVVMMTVKSMMVVIFISIDSEEKWIDGSCNYAYA